MKDSEIAERMLKLFDGGTHWTKGFEYVSAERAGTEQWCLIGAYKQIRYGKMADVQVHKDPFIAELAAACIRRSQEAWDFADETIVQYNDAFGRSYEDIRQLLEEVRDEQAERDEQREGTAAD